MNNDTQQRFKSFVINAHYQPASTKHLKERFEPSKRKHRIRIAIEKHQELVALNKEMEGSYSEH
tara:strand:- start:6659 stop:6850 length:192 start_codon:yes stop_codon:yes gene_type:complete